MFEVWKHGNWTLPSVCLLEMDLPSVCKICAFSPEKNLSKGRFFTYLEDPGMTEMFFLTDEKRVKVRGPFFYASIRKLVRKIGNKKRLGWMSGTLVPQHHLGMLSVGW